MRAERAVLHFGQLETALLQPLVALDLGEELAELVDCEECSPARHDDWLNRTGRRPGLIGDSVHEAFAAPAPYDDLQRLWLVGMRRPGPKGFEHCRDHVVDGRGLSRERGLTEEGDDEVRRQLAHAGLERDEPADEHRKRSHESAEQKCIWSFGGGRDQ